MWKWLIGGLATDKAKHERSRLAKLLRDYVPATPPHRGTNGSLPSSALPRLTIEQFRENLAWQLEATPGRLAILRDLLSTFGVVMDEGYREDTRKGFVTALDKILTEQMPSTYSAELTNLSRWEVSDRAGPEIVYSLIADLAWLEGDILIHAKPGAFWGLDLNPRDRNMLMYGRPCVLGLSDSLFPGAHNIYYLEEEWLGIYGRMDVIYPGRFDDGIGSVLLQRIARDVVEDDLPDRRAKGWLARAV